MAARSDPYEAPAIRAFGIALETRRSAAELNKNELAEKLGCTPQYVGQIEAAKNIPSKAFAHDLETFFETDGMFFQLWKLINETKHAVILPPGFPRFPELEERAGVMRMFDPLLITGLLQTADYAREVLLTVQQPAAVDPSLAARMKRQEILIRRTPRDSSSRWTKGLCGPWSAAPRSCARSWLIFWRCAGTATSCSTSSARTSGLRRIRGQLYPAELRRRAGHRLHRGGGSRAGGRGLLPNRRLPRKVRPDPRAHPPPARVPQADRVDHGEPMKTPDLPAARWLKSSRSGGSGGQRVEVAGLAAVVAVRDSKNPGGPVLSFGRPAFRTFTHQIRSGRYDV